MNSLDSDFDWHRQGVFIAVQNNVPFFEAVANTGYGCRAELVRAVNRRWSVLQAEGWVIQEYCPDVTSSTAAYLSAGYLASTTPEWNYPAAGDPAPPLGVKLQLLNSGGIATMGPWTEGSNFIAWAPLLKRNKGKEARISTPEKTC
jgi:hypothetical protein